jgi:hypothetical protein
LFCAKLVNQKGASCYQRRRFGEAWRTRVRASMQACVLNAPPGHRDVPSCLLLPAVLDGDAMLPFNFENATIT